MNKIQSVAIIGRGAIGTLYGMIWSKSNIDLVYIVNEARKIRYEEDPLICNGKQTNFHYVSQLSDYHPVDLIFIATKYSGLHNAIEEMKPFLKTDTIIVSALNGISSEDILRKEFPNHNVIRTIVQGMDSTYLNNEVTIRALGKLLFGQEFKEEAKAITLLEEFYRETNTPFEKRKDIVLQQWNKLMFNCGINQTCAAYYSTYGGIKVGGVLQDIYLKAMKEVKMVANAKGIDLKEEDIQKWFQVMEPMDNEGMPSMRQDIIAHRKTELPLFSGTIIPMAKDLHIEVPVLQDLYDQITKIEADF